MASTRQVSRFSLWTLTWSVAGFVLWTLLSRHTSLLSDLDQALRPPRLGDAALEVARAISVLTLPVVGVAVSLLLAQWAHLRRLRNLAFALVLAPTLAWSSAATLKLIIGRHRPEAWYDPSFTETRLSYPSSHVAVATAVALMLITLATVTRQDRTTMRRWRVLTAALITLVAVDRWLVGANWFSDVVASILLGVAAASGAAAVCGLVRQPSWYTTRAPLSLQAGQRCVVIYNPAKVSAESTFRRMVAHELTSRGWDDPLWATTTPDDPGYAMSRQALAARADLVIVAGGDGTVRVVCSELAHSDIPVAIVPAGTANLLARNLGIPLDESEAMRTALDGRAQPVDLIRVTIDGDERNAEHLAVMGGLGIDGMVMADTNAQLKKTLRSAAYFVAVAQNLNAVPVPAKVVVDGRLVSDNPATLMLVGNVGEIQAGLRLFPDASCYDGELDLLVTGPEGFRQWFKWGWGVLRRRPSHSVTQLAGKRVEITIAEPMPYQFDGDTLGEAKRFDAEVVPGAITVMVPDRGSGHPTPAPASVRD